MKLCLYPVDTIYKSSTQIIRVTTEKWAYENLYCPACSSDRLNQTKPNTPAIDFICPACNQAYQLKCRSIWNVNKVVDASYDAMISVINSDQVPNLILMQYSKQHMIVENTLLVPGFFFTASSIEKRKPLPLTARRAGWVGCNILLNQIAAEGKILMVDKGSVIDADNVRNRYKSVQPLKTISATKRGWTLDVLTIVRRLNKSLFSLSEVYAYESELSVLHPNNLHIRDKIRQQLQILRELNIIKFSGNGIYEIS